HVRALHSCPTRRSSDLGMAAFGARLLDEVLDREPAPPARWRPAPAPPADVAPLLGPWWWMGREYLAAWDAETEELVLANRTEGRSEEHTSELQSRENLV